MDYKIVLLCLMIMNIPHINLALELSEEQQMALHRESNGTVTSNTTGLHEGALNHRRNGLLTENKTRTHGGALNLIGVGLGNVVVSWIRPFANAMGHVFGGFGSSLVAATTKPSVGHHGDVHQDSYDVPQAPYGDSPVTDYPDSVNDGKAPAVTENVDDFMDVYQLHAPNDKF